MSELDVKLAGKSLADFTNTQLRLALGAVLYTNTADMWRRYLNQLGYSGDVSQMLQKYYVEYSVPQNFRNYINAGAFVYSPQQLFADGSKGVLYDNNDFVDSATWRRNLLLRSEEFDNAAWSKTNATVTANAGIAPDGTNTADKLVEDTATSTHQVIGASPFTVVTGVTYTISVYAKAGERSRFRLLDNSNATNTQTFFDLSDGTIVSESVAGSSLIESVGNGWYRCSMKTVPAGVLSNPQVRLVNSGTTTSYLGDGTSGLFIWGAQLETGSTATTYQRITDFNSDFLAAFPRTTLFLDAAGTVPATVNGLVGLQLDKSANLALGADIVVNGGFDTDTVWVKNAGWTISGGTANAATAGTSSIVQSPAATIGRWYRITFDIVSLASGIGFIPRVGGTLGTSVSALGTHSQLILAASTEAAAIITNGAVTGTIDNISVKEIQGNHRYQTTTGSKPVLRGTPVGSSLVTNGDFATDTVWTHGSGFSISGGKLNRANTGAVGSSSQSISLDAGKVIRVQYTIDSITGSCIVGIYGATSAVGATRTTAGTFVDYLTVPAGGTTILRVNATTTTTVFVFDNIEIHDVSAGQVTAPYGLQYDGVDDFMQTAAVDFTATDKMFVCAGVRKLSDAALGFLVELSVASTANAGAFAVYAPTGAGLDNYRFLSAGTSTVTSTLIGYPAPITNVLTMSADITAPSLVTRVNAIETSSLSTTQGTGNYGNYALYFGRRAGTSSPYNGLDFGFVIVGKTLTSTQISSTERYIAQRTGVSL